MLEPALTAWPHPQPPTEAALNASLADEGLALHWWSNGPDDRYEPHEHSYHKVLFCLSGSITFKVHPAGQHYTLRPGDRLDMPPFTTHSAAVGSGGCRCVEGWRQD
jgi:mannose-6-phosphate isomerase-like protein (cupin superfamily)